MKVRLIGANRLTEREARCLHRFLSDDDGASMSGGMAHRIADKLGRAILAAEQRAREAHPGTANLRPKAFAFGRATAAPPDCRAPASNTDKSRSPTP